jgi:polar amino acid transport system substrate-binding protein
MHTGRHTIRLGTVIAVTALAMAGLLVAWPGAALGNAPAAGPRAASPAAIARHILGHAPRGLARTIVLRGTVRIANDLDYPPQSCIDPTTHKLVGFDVDVARRVARILGLRIVWKHPQWANVIPGLRRGLFDVSIGSMTVTPERKKLVAFTGPYYFAGGQVFVKTGGTQITGPGDLAGKTVGVQDESIYGSYLAENTEAVVETYSTDLAAVTDLANGAIDFWMTHPFTGQQMILSGQQVQASGKPLFYEDLAFALKKGEPDWRALLNHTVKQMHEDGSLTTMSKKWYAGLDLTVKQ